MNGVCPDLFPPATETFLNPVVKQIITKYEKEMLLITKTNK
jgi:hypothetical protein